MFKDTLSNFSPGSHFIQQSRTVCANMIEGVIIRNISVKLFSILASG